MNESLFLQIVHYWPLFEWHLRKDAVTKKETGVRGTLRLSDGTDLVVEAKNTLNAWYGYSSMEPKMEVGPFKDGLEATKAVFSLIGRADEMEAEFAMLGMTSEPWA